MGDIQEPVPLVSLLPLRHQSATSICNGVSSRPAMSSTSYPRAHYNGHPISLQPSAPLKWLAGGFDIPTQNPRNASSHTIHFFPPFVLCSVSLAYCAHMTVCMYRFDLP